MHVKAELLEKIDEVLSDKRLPAVVVDLVAFQKNIESVASIAKAHSKKIRVATKSLRVPELIKKILNYGPPFQGLLCYSAQEILKLAELGFSDMLLAYPTLQKADLEDLKIAHQMGVKVSSVFDSAEGLKALAQAMQGTSTPFPVVVDIDVSLVILGLYVGVRRSPIRTPQQLAQILAEAKKYPQLKVIGMQAYEAQVAGLGDTNPFKPLINPFAKLFRKMSVRELPARREAFLKVYQASGCELQIYNGGGTGSLNLTVQEPWINEISTGSAFVCSHLFDYYSNIHFDPAIFFFLQASRSPSPGYVTCLGGGYIGSGEPGRDKLPVPVWPPHAKLVNMEGAGEVQTPVKVAQKSQVEIGRSVGFRQAKAGELAERFNEYYLLNESGGLSTAKTYRGHGFSFF